MRMPTLFPILCLAALPALAQPDFTPASVFAAGDSTALGFALVTQAYEDFIPQTGSAYTWDFSGNTTAGPWTNWAKPTTPYKFQAGSKSLHTAFAASGINEYGLLSFPRDVAYTYSGSQDTLYLDGLHTSSSYMYSPRIPYLAFPLGFGDSGTVRVEQFSAASQPQVRTGSVDRTWVYDGFGSVKFPYGESQEVFRIRTRQIDSIAIGTFVSGTQYDELIWFRKSDGVPVLRFLKNGTMVSAYFASAEPGSSVRKGMHPARSRVRITGGGRFHSLLVGAQAARIRVSDLSGRQVHSAEAAGDRVPLPPLARGVHTVFVEYRDGGSERAAVFIP